MKKQAKNLNAEHLVNTLWDTLSKLKDGDISTVEANAIAGQSREICRVVKTQIQVIKELNTKTDKRITF